MAGFACGGDRHRRQLVRMGRDQVGAPPQHDPDDLPLDTHEKLVVPG
jgi:hypothetical protein